VAILEWEWAEDAVGGEVNGVPRKHR
jgi:hypothetical protein